MTVITLFPEYFKAFKEQGKASTAFGRFVDFNVLNLRDFTDTKYKSVDDYPYGGGHGMVMRADILKKALESISDRPENLRVIYPCPRGKKWDASSANRLAKDISNKEDQRDIVFICGRYEGIDERFIQKYVTDMYSLGDFILTGGELAVMAIIDSTVRLIRGTLGNEQSIQNESFENGLLEHGHFTKPRDFEGMEVPSVLVSGHHKKIEEFRAQQAKDLTHKYRPDIIRES
ncbi:MAG: tRNA (guanosine(37)-N1)-methyltransferase TrmD [Bacteriovoracaceae bacterium]